MSGGSVVLSRRLAALAGMVTPGNRVCDVGCDHGWLSVYLVQAGISPGVIAMDVRNGPLSRAAAHIAAYHMKPYIETRLSDGLGALGEGEADSLVCAGMGGRLMMKILSAGHERALGLQELILQPQSELPTFRRFLREQGYQTVLENMIEEEGKFYPMMKVVPTGEAIDCQEPLFDKFGGLLLTQGSPVLKRYLDYQEITLQAILNGLQQQDSPGAAARAAQLQREMADIRRAAAMYD